MSENAVKAKENMKEIFSYVTLVAGAMLAAFSIEEFLVPCTILDGGVVGISIMINYLSRIPLGILTFSINLPFLVVGMRKLGKVFIAKSAVAMVTFSCFLEIFAPLKNMTQDYLLAVCFGGVFLGIGVEQAKAAMIITNEGRRIADEIYKKMGRTVTILEGEGLISGKKVILYCVLNRLEIYQLKHLINEADASAFITISDVSEIIGDHIKMKANNDK